MSTLPLRLLLALGRRPLLAALGPAETGRLRKELPATLPGLLAQLPDFGARSGARAFLTMTCWLVAFHRALPGRDPAENTALFRAVLFSAARLLPGPLRRLYRWVFFLPAYHKQLFHGVVGGGKEGFDGVLSLEGPDAFSVHYSRCGIQTFLRRIDAAELGPHICSLDEVESEVFALGLRRTGTLGRGASVCDFRWQRPSAP